QLPDKPRHPSRQGCLRGRGVVVQDVRGAMDPAIGHTHLGPQRRRRVQPTPQDRPQAPEGGGQGPLFSTRSKRWVMALRRSWRWRPAAAKGGRPSSVLALRTALRYARVTSGSGLVGLATAGARGREA